MQRLDAAVRDDNLRVGVDRTVSSGAGALGDGLPEYGESRVRGVFRLALACRLERGFHDVLGRLEVGFAELEVDEIGVAVGLGFDRAGEFEHDANLLGLDLLDAGGDARVGFRSAVIRPSIGRVLHCSSPRL